MDALNGELSQRVVVRTAAMEWQGSPSGTVWRKRLHRVGPVESGQVTSVVRFDQASRFPNHPHPDGEEILVLDGVFSDEEGDWPAGSYLLNPEGYRHTPYSEEGCLLFVKLRQYSGDGRHHVAVNTMELPWQSTKLDGVEEKLLYADARFPDRTRLMRYARGAKAPAQHHSGGAEYFVLEGVLIDEEGQYERGDWLRLPPGASHTPESPDGCIFYLKTDAVAGLASGRS